MIHGQGLLPLFPGCSSVAWDTSRDGEAAPGQQLEDLDSAGMGENLERGKGSICGSNPQRPSEGKRVQLGPRAELQNIPVFWRPWKFLHEPVVTPKSGGGDLRDGTVDFSSSSSSSWSHRPSLSPPAAEFQPWGPPMIPELGWDESPPVPHRGHGTVPSTLPRAPGSN